MQVEENSAVSLAAGGDPGYTIESLFRTRGALRARKELEKGAKVTLVLADADGQTIANGVGYVRRVAFEEKRPKNGPRWTERTHTIAFD